MSMDEILEQPPPSADVGTTNNTTRYRRWSVIARSRLDASRKLAGALGIAVELNVSFSDAYGNIDPTCILQSLSVQGKPEAPVNGSGHYIIDAVYSTITPDKKPQPGGPWVWTVRAGLESRVVDLDFTGKRIVTVSEEPLDPPLTALVPGEILHGEGYVQAGDEIEAYSRFRQYNATLNATPFFGAARGGLLIHPFQTQPSDTGWVKMAVDLEYRRPKVFGNQTFEGWQDVFEQKGTRTIDEDATDPADRFVDITVKDENGVARKIDHPVPLDDQGQPQDTSTDYTPAYKVVTNYGYSEFNSIPWR